ncbi:hypothetical protein PYCC9005_001323 [Savitreella phatthalungensis]
MADNLCMSLRTVDAVHIGSQIGGTVSFSTQQARRLSDFTITICLESRVRTVVPAADGTRAITICPFASHKIALPWPSAGCPKETEFNVPFRFVVPHKSLPSQRYQDLAAVEHRLSAKVTEVLKRSSKSLPRSSAVSSPLVLLPGATIRAADTPKLVRFGAVQITASSRCCIGDSFFVQCQVPADQEPLSWQVRLSTDTAIGYAPAMHNRHTERILSDVRTITRRLDTRPTVAVLEITLPTDVETTLDIPGFARRHELFVDLVYSDRTVRMPVPLDIASAAAAKAPLSPMSVCSSTFATEPALEKDDALSKHLRQLSMDALATGALSGSLPTPNSDYSGSSVASQSLYGDALSASASTCSLSPASSIRRAGPEPKYKHTRSSSTMSISSITQTIKTRRDSLIGKFAKKLTFDDERHHNRVQDDLDFSCCGDERKGALPSVVSRHSRSASMPFLGAPLSPKHTPLMSTLSEEGSQAPVKHVSRRRTRRPAGFDFGLNSSSPYASMPPSPCSNSSESLAWAL